MKLNAEASYSDFEDTNLLVDACIARVRAEARLDDDAVLPPLPVVTPRRDVVILTKAAVGVQGAGGGRQRTSRDVPTAVSVYRQSKRPSRVPMMLCGFIAGAAACAAFLASPVGHRPSVERARNAAHARAERAAQATASLFAR